MEIHFLGGSGEQGRASFLVKAGDRAVLLDHGAKRVFGPDGAGQYPEGEREELERVEGIILSHGHEDHSAGLPLLARQGLRLPVYCHPITAGLARTYCRTWRTAVERSGHPVPYTDQEVENLDFRPQAFDRPFQVGPFQVVLGPSGHIPGSAWASLTAGGETLFYSGDMCLENRLLMPPTLPRTLTQVLPQALPRGVSAVILDAAYGGSSLDQEGQERALVAKVKACAAQGGIVLLPVPRIGRGQEILLFLAGLARYLRSGLSEASGGNRTGDADRTDKGPMSLPPVYVDARIVDGLDIYRDFHDGLSEAGRAALEGLQARDFHVLEADGGSELPHIDAPAIIIVPDGMVSNGPVLQWLERLSGDRRNLIMITGYQAPGTAGARLVRGERSLAIPGRADPLQVQAQVVHLTWKAHPDTGDLRSILGQIGGNPVVFLVHSEMEGCRTLAEEVSRWGYRAQVAPVGSAVNLAE